MTDGLNCSANVSDENEIYNVSNGMGFSYNLYRKFKGNMLSF